MTKNTHSDFQIHSTTYKTWVYKIIAVVGMPLLLVFSLEYTLKLIGFGRETGFLISDSKPGYVRTNPDFVSWFMPSNFDLRPLNWRILKDKPENTIRIVVLGESAAQGVPYPSFGFANQLRAQLRTRYPNKNIEILNTGIVAINSHVIYQIAKELSSYSPDLFIIYMGNNEVVGPYGPGCSYFINNATVTCYSFKHMA